MDPEHLNDEELLYHAAAAKPAAERAAYLKEVCRGDPALLARVTALLQSRDERGDFLENLPLGENVVLDDSALTEGPGTVIGRYKLLERIGEGGMAVVYMAEQERPIRRKVALKIIKLGMDTRQVIARFEAERQALALMDHPGIAKVLDAGATETGRPYFVMELVPGLSITEYCDRNSLSTKDRLGLFIQVCHAVQHAHQKGIIHRDLKPSNVMVTHHDGRPVPKVIDFGIAKATNQRLTEKTLFTRYAHIIGTPAYMSPEQAELSDRDIDTRTDIYSLGVLLYELLTGTTPFSEEELRKAGYVEMQRVIREQEPMKPSTRIRTASVAQPPSAGGTKQPPSAGGTKQPPSAGVTPEGGGATGVHGTPYQQVRGDLDWIVMKALEKDRSRRYETPNSLASDIRRHLEHEPVQARGPSATYRVERFLRRHRSQVVLALALAVIAVAAGIVLSMWNRDRAQLAEAEGFKHRGILSQAREQYAKADREAALETIRPILASKHVGPEARLLQTTILVDNRHPDEAVAILKGLLNERPEVAGAAHSLLARILWEGESPDAEKLKEIEEHRRQAEALLPEAAEAYFLRAMTAVTVKEQLASLDRALQLDSGHYESRRLRAYTYYASRKYDRLRDDAMAMTILRPRDPLGYSLRAVALRELGKHGEALVEYDNALAFVPQAEPQHADLSVGRCETLLRMGDFERVIGEAQACYRLSPDRPVFQYYAFCALTALGKYDEATTLFREIIAPGREARLRFQDWCAKYVFDTLEAGRSWHPTDLEPAGAAFLPMIEAEETYRNLSAKGGRRVTTDGFSANWSPDGKKLVFSLGVHGYSGVAIFDPATKETDLLIVPGKDPRWSPDGKYIAFVRDCELLRLEELATAERRNQHRPVADEEVWVMNADGTEPRRIVQGSWPLWAGDSEHLYYYLPRGSGIFCWVSLAGGGAERKEIMKCSNYLPTVSPDNRHVSYSEGGVLKIADLASQEVVAEGKGPALSWGATAWSPTGNEVCLGGSNAQGEKTGLWIYDLRSKEFLKVLDGQVNSACWSPAATELSFGLRPPYFEIWNVPLDPTIPTIEVLGPGQTLDEHYREMLAFYTQRIEADPDDAYAYSTRAQYHDCLGDRARATADMRQWSAILSEGLPQRVRERQGHRGMGFQPMNHRQDADATKPHGQDARATFHTSPQDSSADVSRDLRRIIKLPFDCELVFSAERPVNTIPMMSVAFGQKGRCEMKLFRTPMFIASLLGFCVVSGLETSATHADFTFGKPVNLEVTVPALDAMHESICCFSYDGLEVYIDSDRAGGYGSFDLMVLRRPSTDADWGPPENLGPGVNSSKDDCAACISADGLTLYFAANRAGGHGEYDIWVTTRATKDDSWQPAVNLGPTINTSADEANPWISPNGLELYFGSYRSGGYGGQDIWLSTRTTTNAIWDPPVNLGPMVNTVYDEHRVSLSPDALLLLFCDPSWTSRPRPGGYGGPDIWMARRASSSATWGVLVNIGPQVNGIDADVVPRISHDGYTLYFATLAGDIWDNWQVPIIPIVDFNGDGKVDGKDLLVMVMQLGGTDSLCDIGPYAWGDGVVDFKDLKVLAEHIGEENIEDPTLAAHWAFDETEGMTAADSAGEHDAMVMGGPAWQPEGKIGGALAFDGIDDFVIANSGVDLEGRSFSVIAWVKGGAPGQAILSLQGSARWLYTNSIDGSLMSDLSKSDRAGTPLFSDVVVTDGRWHRVVLVWDGADRVLYVDDKETVREALGEVSLLESKFILGSGGSMQSGSFWSGLIDDVRIYSRVVRP